MGTPPLMIQPRAFHLRAKFTGSRSNVPSLQALDWRDTYSMGQQSGASYYEKTVLLCLLHL